MAIEITTQDWVEIENLTADKTYTLQAKTKTGNNEYKPIDILFTQASQEPTNDADSFIGDAFKFKKGTRNVYIKTKATPITIHVEES